MNESDMNGPDEPVNEPDKPANETDEAPDEADEALNETDDKAPNEADEATYEAEETVENTRAIEATKQRRAPAPWRDPRPRRYTFGRVTCITDPDYGLDFGCELDRQQAEQMREFREELRAKAEAYQEKQRAETEAKETIRLAPRSKRRRALPPPADSRRAAMKVYGRAMARCERVFDQLIDYDERALDLSDKLLALELTPGLARSMAALGHAFNRLCLANKHHLTIDSAGRGAARAR